MKLIFKITVHHGTDVENVASIIKNGFDINTISCATQDKEFAKGYGNTLLTFKYPFELRFSFKTIEEDLELDSKQKEFLYILHDWVLNQPQQQRTLIGELLEMDYPKVLILIDAVCYSNLYSEDERYVFNKLRWCYINKDKYFSNANPENVVRLYNGKNTIRMSKIICR